MKPVFDILKKPENGLLAGAYGRGAYGRGGVYCATRMSYTHSCKYGPASSPRRLRSPRLIMEPSPA